MNLEIASIILSSAMVLSGSGGCTCRLTAASTP